MTVEGSDWWTRNKKFLKTHWLILLWFGKNTDGQTADGQIIHIKKKNAQANILHQNKVRD